jgi:hypothetical protein
MVRTSALLLASVFVSLAAMLALGGCPGATTWLNNGEQPGAGTTGTPAEDDDTITPDDDDGTSPDGDANAEPEDDSDGVSDDDDDTSPQDDGSDADDADEDDADSMPGVLQVKAFTDSLEQAAHIIPSAQDAPDDVDVNLTPLAYTVAFKRLVLKQVDEGTDAVLAEVELFSAETVEDALIVDLLNATAMDVLDVESLPAGTYNRVDIEVFYLDMTIPTIYPASTSYDIPYRMVYEQMGVLEPRDFLLELQPEWMESDSALADLVTAAGWYWMEMGNPDNVTLVAGATEHPTYHVLDLFANDAFWSQEHRVLEGGRINPPLEYDPAQGGVVTIDFDVTGTFNFKDYDDETTPADGLWEIRRDGGIHPFPPNFECVPEPLEAPAAAG